MENYQKTKNLKKKIYKFCKTTAHCREFFFLFEEIIHTQTHIQFECSQCLLRLLILDIKSNKIKHNWSCGCVYLCVCVEVWTDRMRREMNCIERVKIFKEKHEKKTKYMRINAPFLWWFFFLKTFSQSPSILPRGKYLKKISVILFVSVSLFR